MQHKSWYGKTQHLYRGQIKLNRNNSFLKRGARKLDDFFMRKTRHLWQRDTHYLGTWQGHSSLRTVTPPLFLPAAPHLFITNPRAAASSPWLVRPSPCRQQLALLFPQLISPLVNDVDQRKVFLRFLPPSPRFRLDKVPPETRGLLFQSMRVLVVLTFISNWKKNI